MALIYELNHRFSGSNIPNSPWASATFLQNGPDHVELHMKVNDITATGFINNWWFNFNGNLADLHINATDSQGTAVPTFATATQNATLFNQGRDGLNWDFSFYSGSAGNFRNGDEVWIDFYSAGGLVIEQFDSSTPSAQGPLYTGANVHGGVVVTKIVDLAPRYEDIQGPPHFALVPETSTVLLGFVMLAGCVGGELLRRRREAALQPVPVAVS
jgi:hypothetical protein